MKSILSCKNPTFQLNFHEYFFISIYISKSRYLQSFKRNMPSISRFLSELSKLNTATKSCFFFKRHLLRLVCCVRLSYSLRSFSFFHRRNTSRNHGCSIENFRLDTKISLFMEFYQFQINTDCPTIQMDIKL